MSILLIFAAFTQSPVETPTCEHLDARKISLLVKRASDTGYFGEAARPVGDLRMYWVGTCPDDRFNASKRTVKDLSSLLRNGLAREAVANMLLDVGPNLSFARSDVDAAILAQTAHEDALKRASAPIMPEGGIGVASLLRRVRCKIHTGKLDSKFCSTGYPPFRLW